jgi:BirA family biotin operon repressor/biotin-[acetyl-CoA-carboxylase] ligase
MVSTSPLPARLAASRHPWASHLHLLAETPSTNDEVLELARGGAPHGTTVLARRQTSGRGRLGRTWESRPGDSLCLSVLVRPGPSPRAPGALTLAAGLAVHRALTALTSLPLHIKWPNDILWEDKKLCGILTESGSTSGRLDYAVIGIGINLNQTASDFSPDLRASAASLLGLTGRSWSADETAASVLHDLETVLRQPWDHTLMAWKAACASLGRPIRLQTPQGPRSGTLLDIGPDGALLFQAAPNAAPERILSAEVL